MNINRTVMTGRLTRDPELRETRRGTKVCNMRLAFATRHKNAGVWEERPNYINVVAFAAEASKCERYLSKGRQIGVDGRIHWREFERQDGSKAEAVEVVADRIAFLDPPPKNADRPVIDEPEVDGGPVGVEAVQDDDEIPF